MSTVEARYFDGRSSRPHSVRVSVTGDHAEIRGDGVEVRALMSELRVSEPLKHAPRILTLGDGSYCEIDDNAAFARLLSDSGHRDSFVVAWQNQWRGVLLAIFGLVAVLFAGYRWVLPTVAEVMADQVPPQWEERLGREATAFLEKRIFTATQIAGERQKVLTDRFAAIAPPDGRDYEIRFRQSSIGPNAIALPGGAIYVTDSLVKLAPDDDAIVGVLAHELGHIEHRHLMRRLFANAAVGAVTAVLIGDVSTVLAALPAILIELDYSRAMEREADAYAIDLLRAKGISTSSLATLFERMKEAHEERSSSGSWPDYLATHPPTQERIDAFRQSGSQ